MTKTLADMTAEEREECVGMWCEVMVKTQIGVSTSPREPRLGILASLDWNGFWGRGGGFDFAGHVSPEMWENATPRFDLPRAWNPDGTPPKGKWCKRVLGNNRNQMSWVGEWENTNE